MTTRNDGVEARFWTLFALTAVPGGLSLLAIVWASENNAVPLSSVLFLAVVLVGSHALAVWLCLLRPKLLLGRRDYSFHVSPLLFEQTCDLLIVTDMNGRILDCNPAAERALGRTRKELLGQSVNWWCGGTDPVKNFAAGWHGECSLRHVDGRMGCFDLVVLPIRDGDRLIGALRVHHDRTRVREAETEWQRACAAAEAAGRARLTFLTEISHEVRTPLHGVLGAIELLAASNLSPPQCDHLGCLSVAAERLHRLLDGVLTSSEIEAGLVELEVVPLSLRLLVAETLGPLQRLASQKRIALTWDVADDVTDRRISDGRRLRQVLGQLAGVALESSDEGSVSLSVCRGDDPEAVKFVVQGGRCARHESSTRPVCNGLEMNAASRLVVLLGGKLRRDESANRFEFTLPFPKPNPSGVQSPASRVKKPNPTPLSALDSGRQTPSVLLLVGDAEEREDLKRMLDGLGHRATVVPTACELLAAVIQGVISGMQPAMVMVGEPLPDLAAHQLVLNLDSLDGYTGRTILVGSLGRSGQSSADPIPAGVAVLERPVRPEQLAQLLGS
jgi:two-component system, sensor histidine kinase and response regulator